jgi:sulfur relay (sulfurtransferase) complex TusBCD TusD component (DsrE family)
MTTLIILNDAPYGIERLYDGSTLDELTAWVTEADEVVTF